MIHYYLICKRRQLFDVQVLYPLVPKPTILEMSAGDVQKTLRKMRQKNELEKKNEISNKILETDEEEAVLLKTIL